MESKQIQEFFNMSRIVRKMTPEDMEIPENQGFLQRHAQLEAQYLQWKDACNDPAKMETLETTMDLVSSFNLLGSIVQASASLGLCKGKEQEIQEALKTVAKALQVKIDSTEI